MVEFKNEGIEKAIRVAGSQQMLADTVGYGQTTISFYLRGIRPVPIRLALALEKEPFCVPRWLTRPDLGKRKA
jgi:DNA-binding transcriptional regulator YdaS (Cro superfamily)